MTITIEDFEEDFINKFSQEHQEYIINFCNTFQKVFPNILDKEALIQKISKINSIEKVQTLNHGEGGRTEYNPFGGENTIKYLDNFSEIDKKNVIYHELLHVLSRHSEIYRNDAAGLTIEGFRESKVNPDRIFFENVMLDEIMNEFYTVKLLKSEENIEEKNYTITAPNYIVNRAKDNFRYFGNGYRENVHLAEIIDYMFGDDLLKAKLLGGQEFRAMFNEKYKDINISIPKGDEIPPEEEITPYERLQFQIGLGDSYKPYETVIDIWKTNEKENLKEKEFSLYEYLKKTNELISFLPIREQIGPYRTDKGNGIPPSIFSKLEQMDSEFICEYINPDIMNIKDENMKKIEVNKILSILNILRENINELSEEDIENVSYGKIEEYTHNGRDCLVINTKSTDFMTFVDNREKTYNQFSAYSKFKHLTDFKDFQFTKEDENEVIQEFAENGYEIKDFTYATVFDAGQYGRWILVKSNDSYYRGTGEISEVNLSDIKTLGTNKLKDTVLDSELNELVSETRSTDFYDMTQNIKNMNKENEQLKKADRKRT